MNWSDASRVHVLSQWNSDGSKEIRSNTDWLPRSLGIVRSRSVSCVYQGERMCSIASFVL